MKINWGLIIFLLGCFIFVGIMILAAMSTQEIRDQEELFCESSGGKYDWKSCLIKENGFYQRYDIDWDWNIEKGVREFFLIRE